MKCFEADTQFWFLPEEYFVVFSDANEIIFSEENNNGESAPMNLKVGKQDNCSADKVITRSYVVTPPPSDSGSRLINSRSESCLYSRFQQEVVAMSDEDEMDDLLTEPLFTPPSSETTSQLLMSSYASGMGLSSASSHMLQNVLKRQIVKEQYALADMCESTRYRQVVGSEESLCYSGCAGASAGGVSNNYPSQCSNCSSASNLSTWATITATRYASLQDLQRSHREEEVTASPRLTTWGEVKLSRESLLADGTDVNRSAHTAQSEKLTTWKAMKQVANSRFVSWKQLKRVIQENGVGTGVSAHEARTPLTVAAPSDAPMVGSLCTTTDPFVTRSRSEPRLNDANRNRYSGTLLELFKRSSAYYNDDCSTGGVERELNDRKTPLGASAAPHTSTAALGRSSVTNDHFDCAARTVPEKQWFEQLFTGNALSASFCEAESVPVEPEPSKKAQQREMCHFGAQWPPNDIPSVTRRKVSAAVQARPLSVPAAILSGESPARCPAVVAPRTLKIVTSSLLAPLPDLSFLRENKTRRSSPRKSSRSSIQHPGAELNSPQTSDSGIDTTTPSSATRKFHDDGGLCERCSCSEAAACPNGSKRVDVPITFDLIALDEPEKEAAESQAQKLVFGTKHLSEPDLLGDGSSHNPPSHQANCCSAAEAAMRRTASDLQLQSLTVTTSTGASPLKPCLKVYRLDRSVSEPLDLNSTIDGDGPFSATLRDSAESVGLGSSTESNGQQDFRAKKSVSFCEKIQFHSPRNSPRPPQRRDLAPDSRLKRPLSLNFDINGKNCVRGA